jgi:chlorite dismutase
VQLPEPVTTTKGTNVLHLFGRPFGEVDRVQLSAAVEKAVANGLQVVCVAVLGAKADLCLMVLGDDLWALRRFQSAVQHCGIEVIDSYVSVTEVSEYAQGMPAEMLNARLNPVLPPQGLRAWCFYPMSKLRGDVNNWYALSYEERERLMRQHGASGRNFKGRILQVVTGSTGLDDYEWGVTLFGAHVDDLKECVYTMRYDEASTLYGEFGPFYTGLVGSLDEVLDAVVAEGAW